MSVVIGCTSPHPPILVPEIGGESLSEIKATQDAMNKMADEVASLNPDILVFTSPHSPAFSDAVAIKTGPELSGSFAQFGAFSVKFEVKNDVEMAKAVIDEAAVLGVPMADLKGMGYRHLEELDHGVLVPLYYLKKKLNVPIVSISISYLSYLKHYQLGVAVQRAAEKLDRRVAFIASGDLSHRLIPSAPAGYNPRGIDFDLRVREIIEKAEFKELLKIDESLVEDAGECGLRSFIALGGAFDGHKVKSEVLSYEGPFGVGYMVAVIEPIVKDKCRFFLTEMMAKEAVKKEERRKNESEPVRLAREAVESYIKNGKIIEASTNPSKELIQKKAGAFVCIKRGDKALRGCIGTTVPCQENLAEEIIKNAIQAATSDPRFPPVGQNELHDLDYSVDILELPELISDESYLDPEKYGVIVKSDFKVGLLLPDLKGADTVKKQLDIAKQKAGIKDGEPVELFRFKVKRYN